MGQRVSSNTCSHMDYSATMKAVAMLQEISLRVAGQCSDILVNRRHDVPAMRFQGQTRQETRLVSQKAGCRSDQLVEPPARGRDSASGRVQSTQPWGIEGFHVRNRKYGFG